jgi:hypothetical protein
MACLSARIPYEDAGARLIRPLFQLELGEIYAGHRRSGDNLPEEIYPIERVKHQSGPPIRRSIARRGKYKYAGLSIPILEADKAALTINFVSSGRKHLVADCEWERHAGSENARLSIQLGCHLEKGCHDKESDCDDAFHKRSCLSGASALSSSFSKERVSGS